MRLLFFIIFRGSFPITVKPVSLQSCQVYASEYEAVFLQPGHMWCVREPFHSALG